MSKLKKNCLYCVQFFDHFIGGEDEIVVNFVGYFIRNSANNKYHIFSHWIIESSDEQLVDNNLEPCAILKSTIIGIEEIKNHGLPQ